MLDPSSQKWGE